LQVEKEKEEVSSTGLIIQAARETPNTAIVVAVGEGRLLPSGIRVDPDVKVGDKVAFNIHAVQAMTVDNEDYLVTFSKDIIAIIEEA
jgi:chaperonin GroES